MYIQHIDFYRIKPILIGSILILYTSTLLCQIEAKNKSIQEKDLLEKIEIVGSDSLKMEYYNQLRRLFIYDNPKKALLYTVNYGTLAKKLGYKEKIGLAKFYEANYYIPAGQNDKALSALLEAEQIFESLNDNTKLISVNNSLGALYESIKQDQEALLYFKKSFQMAVKLNDKRRQAMALNNISNIYYRNNNFEKSKNVLDSVYQLAENLDIQGKMLLDLNYANTLFELKKLIKAKSLYNKIINTKAADKTMIAYAELGLGKIAIESKKYDIGLQHINTAKQLATKHALINIITEVDKWLVKYYENTADLEKAIETLKESKEVHDSIHNLEIEKKMVQVMKKYEAEKLTQEVKILTYENELQVMNLKKSRILIWIGFVTALLLGLFALQSWRLKTLREQNNKILEDTNIKLHNAIEDKNILLREIHHRVKNNLQVISSLLKLQSQYIEDASAVKAIAEGRNRVHSMAMLHKNLYSEENLTSVRMKSYFLNLIEGLFEAYNISESDVKLISKIEDFSLDIDSVIPLGLIANELISNSLKHAFDKKNEGILKVDLYEEDNKLILCVEDNGIGYDIFKSNTRKSFGQKLIKSLSEKLEATLEIETHYGTKVTLKIKDYQKK